jgi:hypothetical protein
MASWDRNSSTGAASSGAGASGSYANTKEGFEAAQELALQKLKAGQATDTSGTADSTTSTTSTRSGSTSTQNMDPKSLAALEVLIQQLVQGGTPEQRASQAQRDYEIGAVRQQRADYSKEAAFADASGAMNAKVADVLRQLMPGLTRAAEGAGASKGALQALAIQEATNRAAQDAAALGLQASVNYGGIAANMSGILEGLTRQTDPVTQSLLAALNVAKGAVSNTQSSETSSSTAKQTGSSSSTQQQRYVSPIEESTAPVSVGPAAGYSSVAEAAKAVPNELWTSELASALGNLERNGGWSGFSFQGI